MPCFLLELTFQGSQSSIFSYVDSSSAEYCLALPKKKERKKVRSMAVFANCHFPVHCFKLLRRHSGQLHCGLRILKNISRTRSMTCDSPSDLNAALTMYFMTCLLIGKSGSFRRHAGTTHFKEMRRSIYGCRTLGNLRQATELFKKTEVVTVKQALLVPAEMCGNSKSGIPFQKFFE